MPTYCYQCKDCAYTWEMTHRVSQVVGHCPKCLGRTIRRLLYAVAGWVK